LNDPIHIDSADSVSVHPPVSGPDEGDMSVTDGTSRNNSEKLVLIRSSNPLRLKLSAIRSSKNASTGETQTKRVESFVEKEAALLIIDIESPPPPNKQSTDLKLSHGRSASTTMLIPRLELTVRGLTAITRRAKSMYANVTLLPLV